MKLNDNITFKVGLYNIGDFFRKYHNGLMLENDFNFVKLLNDIRELKESVKTIEDSIGYDESKEYIIEE